MSVSSLHKWRPAVMIALLGSAWAGGSSEIADAGKRPNVLFIAIDDLNDWVGHLGGNPDVRTPNIDRLARMGVSFTNAHSPAVSCNPARTAVLSGLRPSTSGIYSNQHAALNALTGVQSIPQYFKSHGYRALGGGKLMHSLAPRDHKVHFDEYFKPPPTPVVREEPYSGHVGLDWQPLALSPSDMPDHRLVDWALEKLGEGNVEPMFLAVGFGKPHPPWSVPEEYFALYPKAELTLPRVPKDDLDDLSPRAMGLARANNLHAWVTGSGKWRDAVQAYLATVSFVDDQIGRLLRGLERSSRAQDTVIVLWSDHGLHLGEKHHWHKLTLWEESTRTPLVFVVPGMTEPGGRSPRPVDSLSIYPTLADICGLPVPEHVDGVSLRRLLEDPEAPWDRVALTTRDRGDHAVRSERWRYIRYVDGREELYDHASDPMEWKNLALEPEYRELKLSLGKWMPVAEAPVIQGRPRRRATHMALGDPDQTTPAVFGRNARVKIFMREIDAVEVLYFEIRDITDPKSPLFWGGRGWQPRETMVRRRRREGVRAWQVSVNPEVGRGQTRRYLVRAYVSDGVSGQRQPIAEREFFADARRPRVSISTPGTSLPGGQIEIAGDVEDDLCVKKVDLLISAVGEDLTLYWNGERWQATFVVLEAQLDRRESPASAWQYVLAPPPGGTIRVRALARDCAGNWLSQVRTLRQEGPGVAVSLRP